MEIPATPQPALDHGDAGPSSATVALSPRTVLVTDDGRHRIHVGDCTKVLPTFAPSSVDVVVTSPPYNLGIDYRTYADRRPREEYLAWLHDVFEEIAKVLAPNGSFFLNVGATNIDPWLAFDVATQARERFVLQNHLAWVKSVAIGERTHGHFKPITSARFLNNTWEDLFHFTLTGKVPVDREAVGVPLTDKSNLRRFGHESDRRCKGNAWFVPYPTVRSRAGKHDHPATYPDRLAEDCLRLAGVRPDSLVLDPFAGSGTTLVAARRLGSRSVGIELDAAYAATAMRRLEAALPR